MNNETISKEQIDKQIKITMFANVIISALHAAHRLGCVFTVNTIPAPDNKPAMGNYDIVLESRLTKYNPNRNVLGSDISLITTNLGTRIVCSACKIGETIIPSIRHFDKYTHEALDFLPSFNPGTEVQGFIDNKGNFHTRTEAWKIANAAGQIIRIVGGNDANGGTLFSENLY